MNEEVNFQELIELLRKLQDEPQRNDLEDNFTLYDKDGVKIIL